MKYINFQKIITFIVILYIANCSSLPYIIEDGDFESAKEMIRKGADVKNTSACFHALTIAAEKGDKELVQLLLEKGADVNARSNECDYTQNSGGFKRRYKWGSRTALDTVKNVEIAKILLKAGANPNISGYQEEMYGVYIENALNNAIRKSDFALVKLLVESGADVNLRDSLGKKNMALDTAQFIFDSDKKNKKDTKDSSAILQYLKSRGAREIPLTTQMANATEGKILTKYIHVATKDVTEMPSEIAKAVYENPKNFSPLTLNAADGKFYHYNEFVWAQTGQNLFEWYLLRRKKAEK